MWFDVDFGNAGLTTVGYRQYAATGADAVARTTTGVVEVGGGAYGADIALDADAVGIEWDTGEASPDYAHESLAAARSIALIEELYKHAGLELGNAMTVTKYYRRTADGTIDLALSGDGKNETVVTRQ